VREHDKSVAAIGLCRRNKLKRTGGEVGDTVLVEYPEWLEISRKAATRGNRSPWIETVERVT